MNIVTKFSYGDRALYLNRDRQLEWVTLGEIHIYAGEEVDFIAYRTPSEEVSEKYLFYSLKDFLDAVQTGKLNREEVE